MSILQRELLETRISDVAQCGLKRTQVWNSAGVHTIRDFLSFEGTPPTGGAYDTLLKNIIGMVGNDIANELLSKRKTPGTLSTQSKIKQIQTIKHNWFNKKVHISVDGKIIRVGIVKELAFTTYAGALAVVSLRIKNKPTLLVFTPQYLICMYNNWLMSTIVSDDDEDTKESNSMSDLRFYLPPLKFDECPEDVEENSVSIVENETNLIVECVLMNQSKYVELMNKNNSK